MKTKYFFPFLLAFFLSSSISKAQNYVTFPDSNAVWSVQEWSQGHCPPTEFCNKQYRLFGDTIIDTVQYHKIYTIDDTISNFTNSTYFGAIREQEKKIYFLYYSCQNEIRLYDFSKNVGDTLQKLYSEIELCGSGYSGYATVTSVDSVLIDGNYRKVIHLDVLFNNHVWIEGIGSTNGLFNPIQPPLTCMCSWDLVCFQQNDSMKYLNPNFSSCFPVITNMPNRTLNETFVNIFPNPVTGISTIKWDISDRHIYSTLIITDILEKNIKIINVLGKNEITISKNDYTQGLYFGRLIATNRENYFIKFIIQ